MKKATLTLGAGLILLTGWLLVAGIASAEQETSFDYLFGGTAIVALAFNPALAGKPPNEKSYTFNLIEPNREEMEDCHE